LSVRCFRRLRGCSFLADNSGSFLTFPRFVLKVDDSSDCTITGQLGIKRDLDFDSRLVGMSSAVSDNTRNRKTHRPSSRSLSSIPDTTSTPPDTSNISPSVPTTTLPSISEEVSPPNTTDSPTSLLEELNLPPDALSTSQLSPIQIQEISTAIVNHLKKYGQVTTDLLNFIHDGYTSKKNSTSSTPVGHPILLASNKMSNTAPSHHRFTIPQLSRYYGFQSLKNWDTLHDVCVPNFSFIQSGEMPVELGNVANIKKSRSNKNPIDCPKDFMEVVHCDIGYRDTKSVGNGAAYCMVFVDCATCYTWIYPLKSLTHTSLKAVMSAWAVDAGQFPTRLYTDFDCKLLEGPTAAYLRENKVALCGSPAGRQNQNGLVERTWQTITGMGRAFITDMQMPRQYWYLALRQAVQVHNYVPCTVEGISTTPHELVYGVKPDLWVLFRMFSTGVFRHTSDGLHHRSGIAKSKSIQGIALGHCRKSDGMLFYCPCSQRIYSSSDYKLDEGRNTPNLFNL
jgi:hypothetical protein